MAYQLFAEGKDTGWSHIGYKIEYDTARDKTKIGIRYKITWTIDYPFFFGYNIVADVWVEGTNHGKDDKGNYKTVKANIPNTGSGTVYFPNENDYYWFDKGYTDNSIKGCRVVLKSTNGGTVPYDTGTDRTVTAPIGYAVSTISNNINFNIGKNIPITIADTTNLAYNYKLFLDIYNESNTWKNVKIYETTSKNFTLDIFDLTDTIFDLLPTRNSAKIRVRLETMYSNDLIGTFVKEGNCYVKDSNPDLPIFNLIYNFDWFNEETLTHIRNGYGPYNPNSNIFIRIIKPDSLQGKNGATLTHYIFKGGTYTSELDIQRTPLGRGGFIGDSDSDSDSQYEEVYVTTVDTNQTNIERLEDVYNTDYSLTIVDSRGNQTTRKIDCTVDYFTPPYLYYVQLKRVDDVEKAVKVVAKGRQKHTYSDNYKPTISYMSRTVTSGDFAEESHAIKDSEIFMGENGEFTVTATLEYKAVGTGFNVDNDWIIQFSLYTPPMPQYTAQKQEYFLQKGKLHMYYSKNGIAFGAKYDEAVGGALQVDGLQVVGFEGGKTLYENANGSLNKITLSDTSSNYKYFEIFFKTSGNGVRNSVKVFNPNGKKYNLICDGEGLIDYIVIGSAVIEISGNTISFVKNASFMISTSASTVKLDNTNEWYKIKILDVVGYR